MQCLKALCFAVFFISVFPQRVMAHTLGSDESIGAIFHLEPDHSVVVGEPAFLSFEFIDKQNSFDIDNCSCRLIITSSENQEVLSKDLVESYMTMIFPKPGLYNIVLAGAPEDGNGFKPFSLNYEVRVEQGRDSNTISDFSSKLPLIMMPLGGLVVATLIVKNRK